MDCRVFCTTGDLSEFIANVDWSGSGLHCICISLRYRDHEGLLSSVVYEELRR